MSEAEQCRSFRSYLKQHMQRVQEELAAAKTEGMLEKKLGEFLADKSVVTFFEVLEHLENIGMFSEAANPKVGALVHAALKAAGWRQGVRSPRQRVWRAPTVEGAPAGGPQQSKSGLRGILKLPLAACCICNAPATYLSSRAVRLGMNKNAYCEQHKRNTRPGQRVAPREGAVPCVTCGKPATRESSAAKRIGQNNNAYCLECSPSTRTFKLPCIVCGEPSTHASTAQVQRGRQLNAYCQKHSVRSPHDRFPELSQLAAIQELDMGELGKELEVLRSWLQGKELVTFGEVTQYLLSCGLVEKESIANPLLTSAIHQMLNSLGWRQGEERPAWGPRRRVWRSPAPQPIAG